MGQSILCSRSMGVCVFCPCFYSAEPQLEVPCLLGKYAKFFCDKSSVHDNSSNMGTINKHADIRSDNVLSGFRNYIVHNLFTPKKMELALGWKIAYMLGVPVWALAIFTAAGVKFGQINFESSPEPIKNALYFVSIVALVGIAANRLASAWINYQKGRELKIQNDKAEYELNEDKKKRSPKK